MKKVLSLLLAAVMIVSMFAGLQITSHALASSGSCGDNVTWTFNSSTGLLTISGNGAITIYAFYRETNIKKVVIKSGVTRIGSDAFSGCSGLTSVTIPNSVTSIGGDAFYDCSGLTSVTIPNSVTSIGYNAFDNCSGLTSVTIPNSVTSIESAAFADCSGLTSVIIPDSVTSIGDSAFFRCRSLTSVTIGNSVTSIGSYAFEYCNGLTSVTIPNSVTSIGDNAFYECERLKNVYYSGNEAKWNSISIGKGNTCLTNASREYAIISSCGDNVKYVLIPSIGKLIISGSGKMTDYSSSLSPFNNQTSIKTVVINNGITSIGGSAFSGCSGLTSVTIPDSVTSIGKDVFKDCVNLNRVDITSMEAWCNIAFSNSTGNPLYYAHNLYLNGKLVENLIIPYSVTTIKFGTFFNCTSLKNVTIPRSVVNIKKSAFNGCNGLTSVKIPDSVTSIGEYAFRGCSGLTSFIIRNSVTSIGNYAFYECEQLKNVYYSGNEVEWNAISIGKENICLTNASREYVIISFCGSNNDVNYLLIPSTGEVIISGSGEMAGYSLGHSPFYNKAEIKTVVIEDGVTSIGSSAFEGCSGLTSVTIPDSVTSIGSEAFNSCSGLTKVNISSIESWCKISFEISRSYPGTNPLYYAHNLYLNGEKVTDLVIPNSVTSIGKYAFYGCTGLTSVTIPDSVTSIGECAFSGCSGLTSVTIPDSVTSIGGEAFYYCSGLTSVNIPNSVTSIRSSVFSGCKGLTSVNIPNSVTSIGSYTFSSCSGLTSVNIPNSVTSIGSYTFYGCSGLTSVTIPNSVTSMGENVFSGCSGLTSVTIPDSVTSISKSAFNGCSGLTSVKISNSVTNIGNYAFNNCSKLTDVYFSGTESDWNNISIGSENSALTNATIHYNYQSAHEHNYTSVVTTAPTCGNSGIRTYTCSGCGHTYTEVIPATGAHTYSSTITTAATCGKTGVKTFTCSVCAHTYTEAIPATGAHNYTSSITTAATCTNAGTKTFTCSVCGTSYTETIPAKGHKFESTSQYCLNGCGTVNPNYSVVSNPFTWEKDNWAFTNSSYSGYFASGPYRDQINVNYQNVLKNNLTNSEYQCIFKGTSYSEAWLDEDWGGSCYGMSSTTLLAKAGLLPYSSYQLGANNLYQLKAPTVNGIELPLANANVSSLITYYQMLQVKNIIQQQYRSVPYKSNKENITNLISLLDKNDVVLVGFKKKDWGGHAILAYGYEYGSYSKNGITYQGRIKICDPNHSSSNSDNYYIYFNTNSYNWAIPAYASAGIYSTKGAVFNYIGASVGDINQGGYLSGSANATTSENYIARIDALEISNNRSIVKVVNNNGNYANHSSAPGEIVEDYSYILGGESKGTVGYNLYDSDAAYKVSQEEPTDLALTMDYDDCLLTSSSKAGESIVFDKEGVIQLESEAADYSVGMTYDKDYPTDWFAIEVEGENANQVSLEKEKNGWILEGDNLQNVKVSTNNKSDEAITYFTTEYDSVLIYEVDVNTIGIRVDTDDNGTYETDVKTTDYRPYHMQYNVPALVDENIYLTIKSNQYEYSTMADNGMFELDSIRGDVYRVFAKQKNSLTVCLGDYDTADGEVTNYENVVLPLGDINGDGVIDIADISILLSTQNYGTINTDIDLTGDGNISIEDIAVTLQESNYTKTSAVIL